MKNELLTDEKKALLIAAKRQIHDVSEVAKAFHIFARHKWEALENGEVKYSQKETFEDHFDRAFSCWVQNNRKAWHYWKHKTRRDFRRMQKFLLRKEIDDELYS